MSTIDDYTHLPTAVEATQYDGTTDGLRDWGLTFTLSNSVNLVVSNDEGAIPVAVGDYIVKRENGTFRVMTEADFEDMFEIVVVGP
jgi:hypothetical protein